MTDETDYDYDYDYDYNTEEEEAFAQQAKVDALDLAFSERLPYKDAIEKAEKAYLESKTKFTLDFLKKIKDRLDNLPNQTVAKLLEALILAGVSIESEEELEYWINKLERESMQRLAMYFISKYQARFSLHKFKFSKVSERYSLDDLNSLKMIAQSINKLIQKREPLDKDSEEYKLFLQKEKFFKKIENTIRKDIEKKKNNHNRGKRRGNPRKGGELDIDPWVVLKENMTSQGVSQNSPYWNSVADDFAASNDQINFALNWNKDRHKENELNNPSLEKSQIDKLRGVADKEETNKPKEDSSNNKMQDNSKPLPPRPQKSR